VFPNVMGAWYVQHESARRSEEASDKGHKLRNHIPSEIYIGLVRRGTGELVSANLTADNRRPEWA
jgi:hypothetical protein